MIIHLPEEILEYVFIILYDTDRWSVSKTSRYFYQLMRNRLIDDWMTMGRCKIVRTILDKLSIKNENILVCEYIFYIVSNGVYFSKPVGDEHNNLFISIDKDSTATRHSFEKAIVEDEDGNIIRGVVDYEVLVR